MPHALLYSWVFLVVFIFPSYQRGFIQSQPVVTAPGYTPPSDPRPTGVFRGNAVTSNAVTAMEHLIQFTAPTEVLKPSDAVRKIQALERSELSDPRNLRRVFLSRTNITCNDGSPAGFYIRKSRGSKEWIIFLEGGWYCYDRVSCQNRWLRLKYFMTSKQWTETRNVGGILSQNPEENPYWWNANHVFVPYCSSDSWSGTRSHPLTWNHQNSEQSVQYAFMGSYIVQAVIHDLLPLGLMHANSLLLAGSSAGGTGVIVNLDRVADNLAELGYGSIKVRGLADSGWFLDNAPYSSITATASSSTFPPSWLLTSPAQAVRKGLELWRGDVPERCRQDYPEEAWRCYFGYRAYPTLKAPLFVFQWLFDEAQMIADNVGPPVTKEQWNYIHRTGDSLRKTLENVTGLFAASCISHTVLTKKDWQAIRLGNISLPETIRCWEMQQRHHKRAKQPDSIKSHLLEVAIQHHQKHGHRVPHGIISQTDESMSDEGENEGEFGRLPHLRRKNSAVEFKWRPNHGQARHPIQLSYNGKKQVEMPTWSSVIATSGRENTSTFGNVAISSTVKYTKSFIKSNLMAIGGPLDLSSPGFHSTWPPSANFEGALSKRVGEGGRKGRGEGARRGRKKRRRGHRRRRRKKGEKEEGGEGERKGRRGGNNKGTRRKNVDKIMRRNARSESSSHGYHHKPERRSGGTRSSSKDIWREGSSQCSQRLVERCTWPQCNHSCPKLHNPLTGEEMDFIELLKSFGLDMMSVANALGIDIHTLNNMDHDELLNLLTQQSN